MSDRTIPEPHPDIVSGAISGVHFRAESCGFDVSSPEGQQFVNEVAAVIAQQYAEILWLRSTLHNKTNKEK